jgi:hypothetical protein
MKKGVLLVLGALAGATGAGALDWQLPVTTLRVETEAGSAEDPDDGSLAADSLRTTASLRIREEASADVFGLTVRGSWKDLVDQSGDYRYVQVDHDGSLRLSPAVKLGYTLGAKDTVFAQPSAEGLILDTWAWKADLSASFTPVKGTTLEAGVAGKCVVAADPGRSFQSYTLSASVSTRFGEWLFGARYRGELRYPLGPTSGVTLDADHTGALSLEWDPNR